MHGSVWQRQGRQKRDDVVTTAKWQYCVQTPLQTGPKDSSAKLDPRRLRPESCLRSSLDVVTHAPQKVLSIDEFGNLFHPIILSALHRTTTTLVTHATENT